MEEETKVPCRVQLVFADRHLLSKGQRSEGFRRSWVVIRPDLKTVAEFCRDITSRFGLSTTSSHGLFLYMDGIIIPSSESTSFFRDNDKIRINGAVTKKKKKKAVATPVSPPQIEGNELINKGTIVSSNGISLNDNGEDANKKKKERKRPFEETSSKREQQEVERPTSPKKKKLKLVGNERPITINERRKNIPPVATPSQFHTVNQQPNAPVLTSARNKQVASINKSTSTGFRGGPKGKNVHGACPGNGTHQPLPSHLRPGQARFMSPGAGPSNCQDNRPRGDGTWTKGTSWKPKSRFNGPNAHNRNWQPRRDSSGRNAINSQLRSGNNFTTEESVEKIIPRGEEINEDKLDFESLYPLPNLPREGDVIAYRIDINDYLGCPELSSFRVGRVIVFDPVLMIIFLLPVPEYPTPDCEMSEFEKSMYKEDGSLEIDFESLVDLRLVKEGQVKTAPKMHKSGKVNKSKDSSCQDGAENSLSLLGRNDNNMNSAWEVGEASNAKEATETDWGASAPSTRRDSATWPSAGQYATGFGPHGDYSRGWNSNVSNGNSNSAWETNGEAANADESIPPQQNGWDAWEPSTSRAGASWSRMGQHGSGFGSRGGYSRRGRRGSGGKYFNPTFNN
ncbi:uncharacterized protein LOC144564651 isoform X2 [Carex rostrata]